MTNQQIELIAQELARLMKAARDFDAGNFAHFFDDAAYDDEGNGPTWNAICDRAEALLPHIIPTQQERADWARASRDHRACQRHEVRQLGFQG